MLSRMNILQEVNYDESVNKILNCKIIQDVFLNFPGIV